MNEWHNAFDKKPPDSANSVLVVAEYEAYTDYNVCYFDDGIYRSEETDEMIPVIKWQLITETTTQYSKQ